MSYSHVYIDDCQSIQLHIYVAGYKPMGECVLVILWDAKAQKTLKSVLIDCYEQDGKNELDTVFVKYHIDKEKLNVIVWTHPDLDHSVGFANIVKNYTSAHTLFLMPEGCSPHYKDFLHKEMIKSWLAIAKNAWLKRKLNVERVNTSNRREYPTVYEATYYEDGMSDGLKFSIEMLTPFAGQVFKHLDHNKTHKGNHLSISCLIKLCEISFYFGGDVENPAIRMVEKERLHNVVFVKIPHHGSRTSEELPSILEGLMGKGLIPEVTSVSTGYHHKNQDLPYDDVLEQYKNISSKILLTERGNTTDAYGLVCCPYQIIPFSDMQYSKSGAAYEWFRK